MSAKIIPFPFSPEHGEYRFSLVERQATLDRIKVIAEAVEAVRSCLPPSAYVEKIAQPFIANKTDLIASVAKRPTQASASEPLVAQVGQENSADVISLTNRAKELAGEVPTTFHEAA